MIKKRTYIILIFIMVTFFVLSYIFLGSDNLKRRKYESTIVVGNNSTFMYQNQSWSHLNEDNEALKSLNWKEFDVYSSGEKLGEYLLWYDSKWYAFDKKRNAKKINDDFIGINTNYEMRVLSYKEEAFTSSDYVTQILSENKLPTNSQFTANYKIDLDLEEDGILEELYVISNVFPTDFSPNKLFSIVFIVKGENIYYLYKDIRNNNSFNGCKPHIQSILDADNDDNYEILLSCTEYSNAAQTDILYKYDLEKDEFKILVSYP